MIQRYGQDVYGIILKDPDGQIVLWDDHRAAITPLARALRETLAAAEHPIRYRVFWCGVSKRKI
jgi:hypothetical protein